MFSNFSEGLVISLGWTVLHSLWQGAILFFVIFFLLKRKGFQTANKRYLLANLGLLALLLGSTGTFIYYTFYVETSPQVTDAVFLPSASPAIANHSLLDILPAYLPQIATFWSVGAAVFFMRLLLGLGYTEFLKHKQVVPLDIPHVHATLDRIAQQLNIRQHIRIAQSHLVQSPLVVGWIKPIILFPIGLVNQLSQEELEAILAHELAHIQRWDFVINILQSIVEVLFYYHPVTWWLSSMARAERENCCDDIAISYSGNPISYVKTLVRLQEYQNNSHLAMSFSSNKNQLLNRVQRLLQQPNTSTSSLPKNIIAFLLLSCILLIGNQANTATTIIKEQIFEVCELETIEDIDSIIMFKAVILDAEPIKIISRKKCTKTCIPTAVQLPTLAPTVFELDTEVDIDSPSFAFVVTDTISPRKKRTDATIDIIYSSKDRGIYKNSLEQELAVIEAAEEEAQEELISELIMLKIKAFEELFSGGNLNIDIEELEETQLFEEIEALEDIESSIDIEEKFVWIDKGAQHQITLSLDSLNDNKSTKLKIVVDKEL